LGNSFANLAKVINQSLAIQEGNEEKIKEIYVKNAAVCESIGKVAVQMKGVADTLENYVKDVKALEAQVKEESDLLKKAIKEK
jgi:hypothetical protein